MLIHVKVVSSLKKIVLNTLARFNKPVRSREITNYITENNLYDFKSTKVPNNTVSSILSNYCSEKNPLVKRVGETNNLLYFLTKDESNYYFDEEPKQASIKIIKR